MTDSLLDELASTPAHDQCEDKDRKSTNSDSDLSFISSLPIVQKIVGRRRASLSPDDNSDLFQSIALRLLQWRDRYREKSEGMSTNDWNSFAARTSFNEVNRHFTNGKGIQHIPIEAIGDIPTTSVEGETDAEVISLIRVVWQEICNLTLRQRRALLLHSQQLIIYLVQGGINDAELARSLDLNETEWNAIRIRLPLSDAQIAELTAHPDDGRGLAAVTASIKKARHEARARIEGGAKK